MKFAKPEKKTTNVIVIMIIIIIIIAAIFSAVFLLRSSFSDTKPTPKLSCEENGIRLELAGISTKDSQAQILISLTDLEGDKFHKAISLLDSYSIQTDCEQIGECSLVNYDDATNTADFLITLQQAQNGNITGENVTFCVTKILSRKEEVERELDEIGYIYDADPALSYLLPDKRHSFSPVSGVTVSAYGYIEDKLHIQLFYDDLSEYTNISSVYLHDNDRNRIDPARSSSIRDEYRRGRYDEYVFDIDRLKHYRIFGCFDTYETLLTGNWEIRFPVSDSSTEKLAAVLGSLDKEPEQKDLELINREIIPYSGNEKMLVQKADYQYEEISPAYNEKMEDANSNRYYKFDSQGKLISFFDFRYCESEKHILQWSDDACFVRKLDYFDAERLPYYSKKNFYVTQGILDYVTDYQLSEDGKILSMLKYIPIDNDLLLFSFGYWAEYDGDLLCSELYFNTSSALAGFPAEGSLDFSVYQYDAAGKRIKTVSTMWQGERSRTMILEEYQYNEENDCLEYSRSRLFSQTYEIADADGNKYLFYPKSLAQQGENQVIAEKIRSDGKLEYQLRYRRAPEVISEIPATPPLSILDDILNKNYYTVRRGDCLSQIALEHYGDSELACIIYMGNQELDDIDTIYPGQRLYLPEYITSNVTVEE